MRAWRTSWTLLFLLSSLLSLDALSHWKGRLYILILINSDTTQISLHHDDCQIYQICIINKAPELSGDDDKAEVDHEEGADDDEHDKVDPVPERMSVLYKNCFGGNTFTVNFGRHNVRMHPSSRTSNQNKCEVKSQTCTKYMTSVHPSRDITRKMATQARPMLSKEMAPLKGFVGPVVHFV